MEEFTQHLLDILRAHQAWAPPVVALLAFGESLAVVSLLLPATVILWAIGAVIGGGGLDFWPVWFAAGVGAALGDWLSYWLGYHFHEPITRAWPLSRHPELVPRAHALFQRWGVFGVFIGRFFGPLRAVVPLVAGASQMQRLPFQLANWSSAFVWATTTLGPGAFGMAWLKDWLG
jgi:membrane protein DedA with SNARE-associated domain